MKALLAPCGIDCTDCEAYIATKNNDLEVLKKHQKNMLELFNKDIPLDELRCDGCMEAGHKIGFCAKCEIRICAISKGYSTCAECAELPCPKGEFIWKENSVSLAKLMQERAQN